MTGMFSEVTAAIHSRHFSVSTLTSRGLGEQSEPSERRPLTIPTSWVADPGLVCVSSRLPGTWARHNKCKQKLNIFIKYFYPFVEIWESATRGTLAAGLV